MRSIVFLYLSSESGIVFRRLLIHGFLRGETCTSKINHILFLLRGYQQFKQYFYLDVFILRRGMFYLKVSCIYVFVLKRRWVIDCNVQYHNQKCVLGGICSNVITSIYNIVKIYIINTSKNCTREKKHFHLDEIQERMKKVGWEYYPNFQHCMCSSSQNSLGDIQSPPSIHSVSCILL